MRGLRVFRVGVEKLDRDALRRAQEGDARTRPHGSRLAGELDALGLELGDDRVDAADDEAEMVEALVRRGRRRIDAVAGGHGREKHVVTADLEIDARLAL